MSADRARELLRSAAGAAKQLEADVRELVAMRAWTVLGYQNFSAMWLAEVGFQCPTYVQVVAIDELASESTKANRPWAVGHTQIDIAKLIGLNVYTNPKTGNRSASMVTGILRQLGEGVPLENVIKVNGPRASENIDKHGSRSRSQPRRLGARPQDNCSVGFLAPRRLDDALDEIARSAGIPKSEIWRQAGEEYLARWHESRPRNGAA